MQPSLTPIIIDMKKQTFEEKLIEMTKPEVHNLKHQEMLAHAISRAKDKSVVSWWWISIPLYIILAFLMQTVYMPGNSLITLIDKLKNNEKYLSLLIFVIIPIVFILINAFTIRKIYIELGSTGIFNLFRTVWFNVLIMIVSILILIIYIL